MLVKIIQWDLSIISKSAVKFINSSKNKLKAL